jgi:putative ABC transport system permease protein
MGRIIYELTESIRIAMAQIRANKMRSALTALGVVIGILAVTLMGTAIRGVDIGFNNSLAMLGTDVLHVEKWPWITGDDWWKYVNRPIITPKQAVDLSRIIDATPNSQLELAAFVHGRGGVSVKAGPLSISGVVVFGSTGDYGRFLTADFTEGRMYTQTESDAAQQVCVLGSDVAQALFPGHSSIEQTVVVKGQPFRVIGVLAKQGSFLGLFSFDDQMLMPLGAYRKYFGIRNGNPEIQVKVKDKTRIAEAKDELTGDMRRVRGQFPGEPDNFTINTQDAFKEKLDPIKQGIALAGLFVTGLSLFVGAIGIMNITFVSVRERTKEIGTRKALGARRITIRLQFLIEAVSICIVGGVIGLALTFVTCLGVKAAFPAFPLEFSPSLIVISMLVSVATGVLSGYLPAAGASKLDPVVALRYE